MITGIIMASGFSNRMGKNKLLMKIRDKPIIEWVIEAVKQSNLEDIILVYRTEEIRDIAKSHNIKTIYNPNAHLGQSQSVILGVKNAKNNSSYMFLVGDQPFITSRLINRLIEEHKKDLSKVIIPYNDGINTPVIFPSSFKNDLLNVTGDKGGRDIIKGNPEIVRGVNIKDKSLLVDIDTMEEYKTWCNIKSK